MRLYPTVALGTMRKNVSQQDIVLGGACIVPPGVELFMPIFAVHRSASNWPKPDRFLLERWLVGGVRQNGILPCS